MGAFTDTISLEVSLLIMKTISSPTQPIKPRWKRILLWFVGLFVVLPVILFCTWYVFYWGNFDFGREKLTYTDSCGDYRLLYYLTENGNGHVEYANKTGKIYSKYVIDRQSGVRPIWDEDCKGVTLGIGDSSEYLKVPK